MNNFISCYIALGVAYTIATFCNIKNWKSPDLKSEWADLMADTGAFHDQLRPFIGLLIAAFAILVVAFFTAIWPYFVGRKLHKLLNK